MSAQRLFKLLSITAIVASTVPAIAIGDSGFNVLKALAQKASAIQEALLKGSQSTQPGSANGTAMKEPGTTFDSENALDENAVKAARAKMEVVGVRVGMSLDQAMKVLKSHNPKLTVVEKSAKRYADADNKEHISRIYLYEGDPASRSEAVTLIISLPPHSRIINIDRSRKYSRNEAPTMAATLAALKKKYGRENIVEQAPGTGYETITWQVGGRIEKNRPCSGHLGFSSGSYESDARSFTEYKRCGLALTALVSQRQENTDLVQAVSVSVTDHIMAFQDWESSNDYLQNASMLRDKAESEEAKKRGGPDL